MYTILAKIFEKYERGVKFFYNFAFSFCHNFLLEWFILWIKMLIDKRCGKNKNYCERENDNEFTDEKICTQKQDTGSFCNWYPPKFSKCCNHMWIYSLCQTLLDHGSASLGL